MKEGFPPAIILRNERKKNITLHLMRPIRGYSKLGLLRCQALERALNIYIQTLPDKDVNYTEISNLAEEEQLPYHQEYISLLAWQGKIDAYKEDRNWLLTKEVIEDYIKNQKR